MVAGRPTRCPRCFRVHGSFCSRFARNEFRKIEQLQRFVSLCCCQSSNKRAQSDPVLIPQFRLVLPFCFYPAGLVPGRKIEHTHTRTHTRHSITYVCHTRNDHRQINRPAQRLPPAIYRLSLYFYPIFIFICRPCHLISSCITLYLRPYKSYTHTAASKPHRSPIPTINEILFHHHPLPLISSISSTWSIFVCGGNWL